MIEEVRRGPNSWALLRSGMASPAEPIRPRLHKLPTASSVACDGVPRSVRATHLALASLVHMNCLCTSTAGSKEQGVPPSAHPPSPILELGK